MIELRWRTPPAWVAEVEREPLALLSDHAHCELGAAAACQALIVRNPGRDELVRELSETARTELEHFELVVRHLHRRGARLGHAEPNPYTAGLSRAAAQAPAPGELGVLLDRLLVAGLIEARSLERFHLLATELGDPELAALYRGLMASEARHRALFQRLALSYFEPERVAARLEELVEMEAACIAGLPGGPRIHSGPP